VVKLVDACKVGDVFVSATGDKHVIDVKHMRAMRDGAIVANSGHFNVEINVAGLEKIKKSRRNLRPFLDEYVMKNGKKLYLLGEGRLINLVAAEGHPAEVMDMSFADQALAAEYLVQRKGKLTNSVYVLPEKIDQMVATIKLKTMGMGLDKLTTIQRKYLTSWKEGTGA